MVRQLCPHQSRMFRYLRNHEARAAISRQHLVERLTSWTRGDESDVVDAAQRVKRVHEEHMGLGSMNKWSR